MAYDLSGLYNATLGGVGFMEQYGDGFAAPGADDMQDVALLRIPGGDTTVIQDLGRATRTFEVPGAINASNLTALLAKRGQTVTLVRASGTSVSVYVQGFADVRVTGNNLAVYNFTIKLVL
jgi:hypothetical protein